MKNLVPFNRIRYYCDNVLRYDLLLKFHYKNIMQVPQLTKIIILVHSIPFNHVKNVSLALEIICGQKVFCRVLPDSMNPNLKRSIGSKSSQGRGKNNWQQKDKLSQSAKHGHLFVSQSTSAFIFCSLRARIMYHFLDKLLNFVAVARAGSNEFQTQIKGQEIQLTLNHRELRMFPEIQNHFEFFECFQGCLAIKLVTSASNEKETEQIWKSLQQKEI